MKNKMDLIEQIKKGLEDSKTIKAYLINKISYYDFLRNEEKQKIIHQNNFTKNEIDSIIENVKYYNNVIEELAKLINEINKLGLKNYE